MLPHRARNVSSPRRNLRESRELIIVTLANLAEACFLKIPMRAMTAEETMASMRKALPAETELNIVELPKTSVPAGQLEFPLAGLEPAGPTARGTRVWRGSARYGETLRMPIWARVTVARKYLAVVAAKDLPLNVPVESAALRLETVSPSRSIRASV